MNKLSRRNNNIAPPGLSCHDIFAAFAPFCRTARRNAAYRQSLEKLKPKIAIILRGFLECSRHPCYQSNRKKGFLRCRIHGGGPGKTGDGSASPPPANDGQNPAEPQNGARTVHVPRRGIADERMKVTVKNELAARRAASYSHSYSYSYSPSLPSLGESSPLRVSVPSSSSSSSK